VDHEQKLIRLVQRRRDRRAANELVEQYYNEIFAYAFRQTLRRETALDLTQEIFTSALCSIDRYSPEKGSFRTWLYRIATNKIIDACRRKQFVLLPLEMTDSVAETKELGKTAEDRGLLDEISSYVGSLDHETQQVYRLHLYGGYSFSEISRMIGREESFVKNRYYRLIDRIRKEYGDEYSSSGRG